MPDHFHLFMGWLVAGVICAFAGAVLGMHKGAAGAGFCYGLLLGPLGLLLVAVSSDERIQCPVCREPINPSAKVCPKCSANMANLHPEARAQENPMPTPAAEAASPRVKPKTPRVVAKVPRIVAKATKAIAQVTQALDKVSQALGQMPEMFVRRPRQVIRKVPQTVETKPLSAMLKPPRVAGAEPPRVIPKPPRFFIYKPGDEVHGPFDSGQLKALRECGVITGETQFCREGESEWNASLPE